MSLFVVFGIFLSIGFLVKIQVLPDDLFPYPEGTYQSSELRHRDGIPLLILRGSPEERGQQTGLLALKPARELLQYPWDLVKYRIKIRLIANLLWKRIIKKSRRLFDNIPESQQRELLAIAEPAECDQELLIAANTMFALKNLYFLELFGCSTLVANAKRSRTGHLLLGRNMDFFDLGYLHRFSLVSIVHSHRQNIHPFVSIGFPGYTGVSSAMNDAGLVLVSHEVFSPRVQKRFSMEGVPFAAAFRLVIEECDSVAMAIDRLRSMNHAAPIILVAADSQGSATIEITPDTVEIHPWENGYGVCSNHFITESLRHPKQPNTERTLDRFNLLHQSGNPKEPIGFEEIQNRLHAVHQNDWTIQTMIFEPATLTLQLALGKSPVTAKKLTRINLKDFFSSR